MNTDFTKIKGYLDKGIFSSDLSTYINGLISKAESGIKLTDEEIEDMYSRIDAEINLVEKSSDQLFEDAAVIKGAVEQIGVMTDLTNKKIEQSEKDSNAAFDKLEAEVLKNSVKNQANPVTTE